MNLWIGAMLAIAAGATLFAWRERTSGSRVRISLARPHPTLHEVRQKELRNCNRRRDDE